MNGFIVVDKGEGMTSHDVVNAVRRITGQKKAGHTGTLDPFATGVLPVALGEATKAIPYLDEGIKTYRAVMRLGIATDTQDRTGTVIRETSCAASQEEILKVFSTFTGTISQLPPMFSAIKRDGVPLYRLARKGAEVEREPRQITIYSMKADFIDLPFVGFTVSCSRGTYVRTIASDIGDKLDCGAHLVELKRVQSGPFTLEQAVSCEAIAACVTSGSILDILIPSNGALVHMKDLFVTEPGMRRVRNGIAPTNDDLEKQIDWNLGEKVRLLYRDELIAIGEMMPECEKVRILRVFNG